MILRDTCAFLSISCEGVCFLPDNLGAIPQNLHVNAAGPVGMGHNIDLIEFSLRSWWIERQMRTESLNVSTLFYITT